MLRQRGSGRPLLWLLALNAVAAADCADWPGSVTDSWLDSPSRVSHNAAAKQQRPAQQLEKAPVSTAPLTLSPTRRLLHAEYRALLASLVSSVAHEINNSLSQLYLLAGVSQPSEATLPRVKTVAERMARNTELLAMLSRPNLDPRLNGDLAAELKSAWNLLEHTRRLRNCRVTLDVPGTPCPTRTDGALLHMLGVVGPLVVAGAQDLAGRVRVAVAADGEHWLYSVEGDASTRRPTSKLPSSLGDTLHLLVQEMKAAPDVLRDSDIRIRIARA